MHTLRPPSHRLPRTCRVCGEFKAFEEFARTAGKDPQGNHYRLHTCKKCRAERQREAYRNDPIFRAKQLASAFNCNARVKHLPKIDRQGIINLILGATECAYCKHPNDGSVAFAVDHRMPLSLGGLHALENLAACCEPCNRAKHDMHPDDYVSWLRGVVGRAS